MAWPTITDVKAQFAKLNDASLDAKLTQATVFAKNRVLGAARAAGYDVSGFASSTPELAYDIALYLCYGYFAPRVHTGSGMTATDEAARDARDYAEELLKKIVDGEIFLLDPADDATPLAKLGSGLGYVNRRTDGSVFGPGDPETWEVVLLEEGSEMT